MKMTVLVLAAAAWLASPPPPLVPDVSPALRPASWLVRVGQTAELRGVGSDVAGADVHVAVRSHGSQQIIEAAGPKNGDAPVWSFTPTDAGACIVATTIHTPATSQPAVHRYEKIFLSIAPAEADKPATPQPSASATARFGQRLELTPMVDPTCVPIGSDLPIRVKFNTRDLKRLAVRVTRRDTSPTVAGGNKPANQPQDAIISEADARTLATNDSGLINLRIDRAGEWLIAVDYTSAADPAADNAERFIATMLFQVASPQPDAPESQKSKGAKP